MNRGYRSRFYCQRNVARSCSNTESRINGDQGGGPPMGFSTGFSGYAILGLVLAGIIVWRIVR